MLGERNDIGHPRAQRWQANEDYSQPVVKVFAKPPISNRLLKITMRRRDHPHINRHWPTAHRGHHPLLKGAQQLGLHGQVHVTDFVQKLRAALRLPKRASAIGNRASEGAAHMAKQQPFEQLRRNSGAVPAGRVESKAVPDQIVRATTASARRNLRFGRLLVELQQQTSDRNARKQRQAPKTEKPIP